VRINQSHFGSWVFCGKELGGGVNRKISAASTRAQLIREKPSKTVPLKLPSIRWVPFYPFLFIWFGCC